MINLRDNKTALLNLGATIEALESLDCLIKKYSEDKVGPAYCEFEYVETKHSKVQIERSIMVKALKEQRQVLVKYLNTLNIQVD